MQCFNGNLLGILLFRLAEIVGVNQCVSSANGYIKPQTIFQSLLAFWPKMDVIFPCSAPVDILCRGNQEEKKFCQICSS